MGDLSHVDRRRAHLDRRLIGNADWAAQAVAKISEMARENYTDLVALEKRKRRKKITSRKVEGPRRPLIATVAKGAGETSWLPHTVRGAISGTLKKKLCVPVTSQKVEGRGTFHHLAGA